MLRLPGGGEEQMPSLRLAGFQARRQRYGGLAQARRRMGDEVDSLPQAGAGIVQEAVLACADGAEGEQVGRIILSDLLGDRGFHAAPLAPGGAIPCG